MPKFTTRDQATIDRWDRSGARRGQRILDLAGYPAVDCPRCGQPAKVKFAKDVFDPWLRCDACFARGPRNGWEYVIANSDGPDDGLRTVYGEAAHPMPERNGAFIVIASASGITTREVHVRTAWDLVLAVE